MKKSTLFIFLITFISTTLFSNSLKLFMLRDNGPLRKANNSNGVEWSKSVRAGTELELLSSELVLKNLVTSNKIYENILFYKVQYKGEVFYVQETDAEPAEHLSVIQNDTLLFTYPSLSSFRNAILETGSFVIKENIYSQIGSGTAFRKIIFYDTIDNIKRIRYINQTDISDSDKDVKAIMLLENARTENDEALKNELLDNAISIKTTPLIRNYLTTQIAKIRNISFNSYESNIPLEEFSTFGYIKSTDDSNINVYLIPGISENVIGQFNADLFPIVLVTLKTARTVEFGEKKGYFYYVTECDNNCKVITGGLEGWIFEEYLQFLED